MFLPLYVHIHVKSTFRVAYIDIPARLPAINYALSEFFLLTYLEHQLSKGKICSYTTIGNHAFPETIFTEQNRRYQFGPSFARSLLRY